jgi:class 3 adenylate cyclase
MPLPKVIPALSDLTQDIAGPLPVDLLHRWATGEQDLSAAASLLSSFQIQGTVVCTDTSGLSRMTQLMELLDVLSLVSQPKEIVYALGRAIGGRAIGTWVADNTEMFYPENVEPETVVDAMAEVQCRIDERLKLRIGMCIHSGVFYEIGGGLYGGEADRVEHLAEQCAGPREILLTERVARQLKPNATDVLTPMKYPHDGFEELALRLKSTRRMPALTESDTRYPQPFPRDFYELLPHFQEPGTVDEVKRRVYERWLRDRIVVFMARHHEPQARTMAGLLDDLVINALMDTVMHEATRGTNHIASSGGGIGILTFEQPGDALEFTRQVHARLAENGLPVLIGVDSGPVLLFENWRGPSGIAGDAINIASKLAEDIGRPNCISVTGRAAQRLGVSDGHERFETTVSGITLRGVILT